MATNKCIGCNKPITQPTRNQGGGTRRLYCSHRCRSRIWAQRNADKRKTTIAKYQAKPDVQLRRGQQAQWLRNQPGYKLKVRLRQYGLSVKDYQGLLARQNNKCAGCRASFEKTRDCIDPEHKSGRVRGLLCDNCNTALGRVKESREILYRLAAYVELDRATPVVYLIGSLQNPKIIDLGNDIRSLGIKCVENWMAAGPLADKSWQEYSNRCGKTYSEALESREAKHIFHFDKAYIDLSDAVVLYYPAGRSAHLEFGYATGQGKRGYILMETPTKRYDVMLQFAGAPLFHARKALLEKLQEELGRAL